MAARVIPMTEVVHTINIDSTFKASPKAIKIPVGDGVSFTNGSGASINIQFEPNPPGPQLCVNSGPIAPGSSYAQGPFNVDGSVNYYVYQGTTVKSGPYAIQVGSGPLYIQITYSQALTNGQCTPDPVALPYGGTLQMISNDYTYNVSWPGGDPFTPPGLTTVYLGAGNNSPHTEDLSAVLDYSYRVQKTTPGITEGTGNGGGTVKVKGQ